MLRYLDRAGGNVAVVGKPSCEGRAVEERVVGLSLREFELPVESVRLLPKLVYLLLLFGDGVFFFNWTKSGMRAGRTFNEVRCHYASLVDWAESRAKFSKFNYAGNHYI